MASRSSATESESAGMRGLSFGGAGGGGVGLWASANGAAPAGQAGSEREESGGKTHGRRAAYDPRPAAANPARGSLPVLSRSALRHGSCLPHPLPQPAADRLDGMRLALREQARQLRPAGGILGDPAARERPFCTSRSTRWSRRRTAGSITRGPTDTSAPLCRVGNLPPHPGDAVPLHQVHREL